MTNILRDGRGIRNIRFLLIVGVEMLIARKTLQCIAVLATGLSLSLNVFAENRLDQQRQLAAATSSLQTLKLDKISDVALNQSALGILALMSAKLAHLSDLEELELVTSDTAIKGKIRTMEYILRHYYFGSGCAIDVDFLKAFASSTYHTGFAASLTATASMAAKICISTKF